MERLAPHQEHLPPYPLQNGLMGSLRAEAAKQGNPDYLALWAGQNFPLIRHTNAGDLFAFLLEDTEKILGRLAKLYGETG